MLTENTTANNTTTNLIPAGDAYDNFIHSIKSEYTRNHIFVLSKDSCIICRSQTLTTFLVFKIL
ncbi:MAG: hypothetical protein ACJ71L_01745 [Nitrososphaeraceae archaeon]